MKLAVIDLGTNTCNLVIAEIDGQNYQILHQGKVGVKLGKGGINKKMLTAEAFERAVSALKKHQETIARFDAHKTITIATSAVRDADNKAEFTQALFDATGLELSVISGEEEARLIFDGVTLALDQIPANSLIMDIGGGSNEFIQTESNRVFWKESFPLGMARVVDGFKISDPILPSEIIAIESWFASGLANLWNQFNGKRATQLIGCSGAFDTLADLIDDTAPGTKARITQDISLNEFNLIADMIIRSTKSEREKLKAMEPLRVEMIVPAFILIRLVLRKLNISKITQTDFALREGVLKEWINR
ncbi:Ppx/GppA phosphatase family protein [Mangrovibacterium diazotrophicum]|uniref:Exopolyphosphatase/guanosine-5'-triphosphate, 3'-diphosphate pyrophosphatase n=1 Tax=Mangrovibacterium diazotrophicum TaxID=1261403 RepID=A0A419W7C0_9BACT|nr:exopolyphosphatase [Mangrovibacterium diazotrophicum]RKD91377.1 exopolyphosphatase/guanosine-5'-triphosphate,3'-diphosphate pyrophosphatase [Mangrovibacterium diazotrophicum]